MDYANKIDMMDDDCDIEWFPMENKELWKSIIEAILLNPDKQITVCRLSTYKEVTDVSIIWDCIVLHYWS